MTEHLKRGAEGVLSHNKIAFNKKFACFGNFLFHMGVERIDIS